MNRKWTEAQYNAIAAEGGNVLVSAAAGSGKTAVLVERVIQRLTDLENPTPADRILVATFTNAAAAEMKERIAARLTELLEQNPGDSYLMRQRMMLDTASIGTVHAFCLGIIRNNLHLLQVPPDFRIGDEKELNILKEDIAKELLEEYYSVGNKTFADMVELFSTGRDDSRVLGAIFQLYSFVRSHPFYNSWLDSKLLYYSNDLDAEQTLWGKTILNYAEKTVQYAAFMNDKALELIKQDDTLTEKYTVYFEQTGNQLRELAAVIRTGCWDTVYGAVNRFSFEKLPIVRGMKDSFLKNQAMNYRDKIKDIINELSLKQFCCDNQGFKQDIKMLYPVTAMLFEITKEFDRRYTLAKFSRKMIDFSDIEHFAIALLLEEKDGEHILTPLAKELRERYMYVLVDEYQDSNEAQDLIFSSVSNGKNLFMVGDVKQSIYRFRQAMPEIFLAKKNSFPLYDGENYPAKIILGNNFRSRRQVTETVNMIFGMLMSEDLGELYYNDEEMLVPLANYPENDDCTTELCLLEYNGDEELSAVEAEAEFVAEKIDAMIKNGFKVNEKGVLREIKAGDIAILMRSLKGKGDIFLKALANVGIKAVTQDKSSFLAAREISVVMSMLRVINNPLNDICLTAVMLSPAFDFTPTDIAKIRMINRSSAMIVNCIAAAEQGDERCQSFIKILDSLRLLATTMPVSRLIVKILEATDFSGVVAAMNNAEVRTANLRLLCEYAAKYEQSGSGGLGGFVAFIDRLEQRDDDLGGAELGALEKNCVRIMSIHASKGLEFPVVLLCDTSKGFNRQDLQSNILLHPEMGFAAMVRDFSERKQHTTIPMEALKLELERGMLSEELRMLYVALTRAKEKIIITSTQKRLDSKLAAVNFPLDKSGRIPSNVVAKATSYADWILMSCLHHPDFAELTIPRALEVQGLAVTKSRLAVEVSGLKESLKRQGSSEFCFTAVPSMDITEQIIANIKYVYPYSKATQLPSKVSVSQIVKKSEEFNDSFSVKPAFVTEMGLSGAEKGIAVHQFMLFANHANAAKDLDSELFRLVEKRFLTKQQADCISTKQMQTFYNSELYSRMVNGKNLRREFRFMADASAQDLDLPEFTGETVTIQGVADAVFEEDNKLVIVDYKTDKVDNETELAERYTGQLELYAKLLSRILNKEVGELLLYSFTLGKTVTV